MMSNTAVRSIGSSTNGAEHGEKKGRIYYYLLMRVMITSSIANMVSL